MRGERVFDQGFRPRFLTKVFDQGFFTLVEEVVRRSGIEERQDRAQKRHGATRPKGEKTVLTHGFKESWGRGMGRRSKRTTFE